LEEFDSLNAQRTELLKNKDAEMLTVGELYDIGILLPRVWETVAMSSIEKASRRPAETLRMRNESDTQFVAWQPVPPNEAVKDA